MNVQQRLGLKHLLPVRTRDAQPLRHVSLGFLQRERMRLGPQRQPLPQLAQMRLLQPLFQFRLAHQHNLQQLLGEGLQICHHANLFQHLVGEALCLVHDQYRGFARPVAIQQPVVQPQQNLALGPRIARDAEIGHHVVQKLGHIHPRIEDERGGHLLQTQPFQQFVDERGLTRAHLAGQQHEPLAALDAVGETGQRFLGVPCQKKVTRVRVDVERIRS